MKPRLIYAMPSYRYFEGNIAAVEHIEKTSTLKPFMYYIFDNSQGGFKYEHPKVRIDVSNQNNLANAWNTMFSEFPLDVVVVGNDDVLPEPNTLELFYKKALEMNLRGLLLPDNGSFSLFSALPKTFQNVGLFDTQFTPIYFEDNDFYYRCKLKGEPIVNIQGCLFAHEGSKTLRVITPQELEQHHVNFRANQARYIDKWGGLPLQETKGVV